MGRRPVGSRKKGGGALSGGEDEVQSGVKAEPVTAPAGHDHADSAAAASNGKHEEVGSNSGITTSSATAGDSRVEAEEKNPLMGLLHYEDSDSDDQDDDESASSPLVIEKPAVEAGAGATAEGDEAPAAVSGATTTTTTAAGEAAATATAKPAAASMEAGTSFSKDDAHKDLVRSSAGGWPRTSVTPTADDSTASAADESTASAAAVAASADPAETTLPAGWQQCMDKEAGVVYFWNTATGEVTWDRPGSVSSSRQPRASAKAATAVVPAEAAAGEVAVDSASAGATAGAADTGATAAADADADTGNVSAPVEEEIATGVAAVATAAEERQAASDATSDTASEPDDHDDDDDADVKQHEEGELMEDRAMAAASDSSIAAVSTRSAMNVDADADADAGTCGLTAEYSGEDDEAQDVAAGMEGSVETKPHDLQNTDDSLSRKSAKASKNLENPENSEHPEKSGKPEGSGMTQEEDGRRGEERAGSVTASPLPGPEAEGIDDLLAGIEAELLSLAGAGDGSGGVDGGAAEADTTVAEATPAATESASVAATAKAFPKEDFLLLRLAASGLDVRAQKAHAELVDRLSAAMVMAEVKGRGGSGGGEGGEGEELGRHGGVATMKCAWELGAVLRSRLSDWKEGEDAIIAGEAGEGG